MKNQLENVITDIPYKVEITYTDKTQIAVDLTQLIQSLDVFAPLENPNEFNTASLTDFGFTLEWSCGASLDSDKLFEMALEQAGMIANANFRKWQDINEL